MNILIILFGLLFPHIASAEDITIEMLNKLEKRNMVFSEEIGKVHGPVQTQFGYHLIEITSRDD